MRKLFAGLLLLLALPAHAANYATGAPGTIFGNPLLWPATPVPVPAASFGAATLAILKGANMAVTTDQALSMMALPGKYLVTAIYATNCTASPSGAVGGLYTAASKGGSAIVSAAQTYTALATASTLQSLAVNTPTTTLTATQLYFALTTAGPASTCDLYVYGVGLQ